MPLEAPRIHSLGASCCVVDGAERRSSARGYKPERALPRKYGNLKGKKEIIAPLQGGRKKGVMKIGKISYYFDRKEVRLWVTITGFSERNIVIAKLNTLMHIDQAIKERNKIYGSKKKHI